jgi:hypothetical protein
MSLARFEGKTQEYSMLRHRSRKVRVLGGVFAQIWLVQAKNEAPVVGRPSTTLFEKLQERDLPFE